MADVFSLVRDRVAEGHEATERVVGHRGLDGLAVVLGDFRPEGLTVGCDLGEGARQESLGPVGGILPVMISKSSGAQYRCFAHGLHVYGAAGAGHRCSSARSSRTWVVVSARNADSS
jgi:hypothetical protein